MIPGKLLAIKTQINRHLIQFALTCVVVPSKSIKQLITNKKQKKNNNAKVLHAVNGKEKFFTLPCSHVPMKYFILHKFSIFVPPNIIAYMVRFAVKLYVVVCIQFFFILLTRELHESHSGLFYDKNMLHGYFVSKRFLISCCLHS